jgi:hypothetical protein
MATSEVGVIRLLQRVVKEVARANLLTLVAEVNLPVVEVVEVSLEVVAPRSSSSCATPCSHLICVVTVNMPLTLA